MKVFTVPVATRDDVPAAAGEFQRDLIAINVLRSLYFGQ